VSKNRLTLVASVLGSGAVFVESTITSVALPSMGRDLHLGMAGLQWVMNGYLLPVSALILLGGALGDRFARRRVFAIGLVAFALASLGCAAAPSEPTLIAARVVQGLAGALVVPNSLALLETAYTGDERGAAIGHWAAWSAISTAFGPLVGGMLIDALSWRWVFICVAPFALAAAAVVVLAPSADRPDATESARVDYVGAALATLGLAGVVGALVAGPGAGFGQSLVLAAGLGGAALLAIFLFVEHRTAHPLLPLDVFRSRRFSGVNATTVVVYAALSGLFFLLMLELQNVLGYSALAAGASLLPINVLMLVLSPAAGRFSARHGARLPMTAGALVAAAGCLLFARVQPGASYAGAVLPAAIVFGLGLSAFVAPLTTVALSALDEGRAGLASGVNNAAARLAGLLATAVIPAVSGLGGLHRVDQASFASGFATSTIWCAGLCVAGAAIAFVTMESLGEIVT